MMRWCISSSFPSFLFHADYSTLVKFPGHENNFSAIEHLSCHGSCDLQRNLSALRLPMLKVASHFNSTSLSLSRSALVLTFYACKLQTTKLSHFNNSGKIQITSLDTTRFPYPKNPILQADTVFENDIKSRIFQKGNQRFRNTILFHYFSDLNFLSQRIISTVFKHCEAED